MDAVPVVWTKEGLQFLPGFDPMLNWWPNDVSDNGSVIVGFCWLPGDHFYQPIDRSSAKAFRWESGQVTLIGNLPSFQHTLAKCVSGDGHLIVGHSIRSRQGGTNDAAFVWDAKHGIRSVSEVLVREGVIPGGWHLGDAMAISRDGSTIVGTGINPDGHTEAWLARLPREVFKKPNGTLGRHE
jgi:uncharacterized membrane protein